MPSSKNDIYEIITPANVLNLTESGLTTPAPGATFNAAWATMQATYVDVEIDFFRGTTAITFGPHKHLSVSEWYDVYLALRTRLIYQSLNARNTGIAGGNDSLDISGTSHHENTTEQTPLLNVQTVVSPPNRYGSVVQIQTDPTTNGGQFVVNKIKNTTGAPVDTSISQVQLSLGDLPADAGIGRTINLPRCHPGRWFDRHGRGLQRLRPSAAERYRQPTT